MMEVVKTTIKKKKKYVRGFTRDEAASHKIHAQRKI